MPSRSSWGARAIGVALVAASPAVGGAQQLTAADRTTAVATIWSAARYNFAYWDRVRADWDSALGAALAAAAPRQTDLQFYHRLRLLGVLLGEARTGVTAAPNVLSRLGRPPLDVRSVEGRPFVVDYDENDEMRVARPERLAEIISLQGVPAAAWVRDSILPETAGSSPADRWRLAVERILEGPRGTAVQIVLRAPGGTLRGASLTRSVGLNERWPLSHPALRVDTLPDHSLWIRLTSFDDPDVVAQFDRVFERFDSISGIILDVRDNDAGTAETGYGILARLTDKPVLMPRWRTPQHRAAPGTNGDSARSWYVASPDTIRPLRARPTFGGPVAVLTSRRTAGGAEDFVAAFRNASRGTVVGEPTAGSPGRLAIIPLPRGWAFRVCVTRSAFADGVEYAGTGIAPEQPVEVTVADLLAGRDAALERARAYLATRR